MTETDALPEKTRKDRIVAALWRRALLAYVRSGRRGGRQRGEGPVVFMLINGYGMGGTIRATFNIAAYLHPTRHVEIISFNRKVDEPFFPFPAGVKVTTLRDKRPSHVKGRLEQWLDERESVFMHPEDRGTQKLTSLWTDVQLVRALRGKTGVLVGTKPGLNIISAMVAPPGMVRVGQEQMNLHGHEEGLRRPLKFHLPKLDAFVVLTERDQQNYRKLMGDRAPRIEVIPNTVRPLGGPEPDLSVKQVFTAGRFVRQKGFGLLLLAWAQVHAKRPDWRLRICGSGSGAAHLRGLIAEHGLQDVVRLDPPSTDMGADMAKASIFVLSSRFEGFPLILLEAMSKGLAVVSFDCPTGPADVIRNRENGIIVPKRVNALAEGLLEMIEDDELRARCGAAAPATAARYTMEAIGPRWVALFDDLSPLGRRETPLTGGAAREVAAGEPVQA